jgi:hypothetical protein
MAHHGGGISSSTTPLGRRGCDDDNYNDNDNAHSPPLHNNQPEMLATMTMPPSYGGKESRWQGNFGGVCLEKIDAIMKSYFLLLF